MSALKKNSSTLKLANLTEDEIALLEKEAAKRKPVLSVVVKLLEKYTENTHVSLDSENWAIRRARKDGQEELVKAFKLLFGED